MSNSVSRATAKLATPKEINLIILLTNANVLWNKMCIVTVCAILTGGVLDRAVTVNVSTSDDTALGKK